MALPLHVSDVEGDYFWGPYLMYVSGWTEERYFVEASESRYMEFADGELIVHSPASIKHQDITMFFSMLLRGYVDTNKLGKVLAGPAVVRLRPDLNYKPDVFFIAEDQFPNLEEQRFSGSPRLVVEVLSESTCNHDLRTKASNYRQYGVEEYWVVDYINQNLIRHLLPEGPDADYQVDQIGTGRVDSRAVRGFWIDVSWLWADPLPSTFDCLKQLLPV